MCVRENRDVMQTNAINSKITKSRKSEIAQAYMFTTLNSLWVQFFEKISKRSDREELTGHKKMYLLPHIGIHSEKFIAALPFKKNK